ncbi:MAG: hypothetical protein PHS49_07880, partial [Candidatus Gracilibacteria bacterium]|nr:hypothetical protein [Candidatus Gracilibacteria bacterium]
QDGGFEFSPNKLLAYTDTGSCTILSENTSTGITSRVDLLKGLQDAYTGTTLKNEGEIKNILALDIDTNNPSTTVKNYASTFVNNVFGSKIVGSNSTNTNINNNTVLEHLTEITSLASIPEANKASFTVVSHSLYSGMDVSYLFDTNLSNLPNIPYWFLGTHYVEIDVASDFRIWSIVTNFSDYNTYDASLKFINSNTLVEVPNTQTDHGRPNASQFRIASSTIPAGRYKVYTQLNSTRNNNQYRLDDEWFIEKMN